MATKVQVKKIAAGNSEIKGETKKKVPLSAELIDFLEGFEFVRYICRVTDDVFSIALENFCEEKSINFDDLITQLRESHQQNDGRPKNFPFSGSFEKEFATYIEKCKNFFPVLNDLLS